MARSRDRSRRCPAFTLVEIMIVVVIIGLLSTMATPAFERIRRTSERAIFVNDLRQARDALQNYISHEGQPPPDTEAGTPPPELEGYVLLADFRGGTPIGGLWTFELDPGANFAAVGVRFAAPPNANTLISLNEVDQQIDDGNLATGNFTQDGERFLLVVQE